MAEQADAPDSKSGDGDIVWVRPPPSAPTILLIHTMTLSHCHLKFSHHTIFEDFNFNLAPGKWTCVLGESGIGKSSLLKILAGLIKPNEISHFQPLEASYLPQQDCLMPWLSVWENVFLGATLRGEKKALLEKKAAYLLKEVGLSHAHSLKPTALSGGMRQRVALVRTLLEEKPVILMDEPFAALDIATRLELHDLINPLLQGKTVLLVTHDPLDAVRLADHIQLLKGTPAKLGTSFNINIPKSRDLQNPEMMSLYMQLLKEVSH